MSTNSPNVIVALDFASKAEVDSFLARFLAGVKNEATTAAVGSPVPAKSLFFKVGLEIWNQAYGRQLVQDLKAQGHRVFLDLKLHDIPNTVYGAAKAVADLKVDLLTVHAAGGEQMLAAAVKGLRDGGAETAVLAITQLTSTSQEQMQQQQGISGSLADSVVRYAKVSHQAGVQGVVCSAQEAKLLTEATSAEFFKVTPGIRLPSSQADDQKRVATPEFAKEQGATHIVVGRPITRAQDPVAAYEHIVSLFAK